MKLDLHVHSCRSEDGVLKPEEIVRNLKAKGFAGAAICDHQTSPDFTQQREDFLFIPAIEYATQNGHLLGLFLQKPVSKTEEKHTDFFEAAAEIHAAGGIAILAHPFEQAKDFRAREEEIKTLAPYLDGIEVGNGRADYKHSAANAAAVRCAARCKLAVTGGSDAHRRQELGAYWFETDAAATLDDARNAILAQNGVVCGKDSPRRYIGLSQLAKCRKNHTGFRSTMKSVLFTLKLVGKDLFYR